MYCERLNGQNIGMHASFLIKASSHFLQVTSHFLRVLKSGIPKQRDLTSVSFVKRLHTHYIFFRNEVSVSMTATKIA